MSNRWEYLVVDYLFSTNYADKALGEAQTWSQTYEITRPGEAQAQRVKVEETAWPTLSRTAAELRNW